MAHRAHRNPPPPRTPREHFAAVRDDQGLSLEELSKAYADLISRGAVPYAEPPAATGAPSQPEGPPEPQVPRGPSAADVLPFAPPRDGEPPEACDLTPQSIVEAILFVGHPANEPISARQLASMMRGVRPQEVEDFVGELNATYRAEGRPYHVVSVGPGYRLVLHDTYRGLQAVFQGRVREARLTQASVDVLAIVAYKPGSTRAEIDQLRGRPSSGLLSQLVRRGLLRVECVADQPRVAQYYPTERFLEVFGLEALDDLPEAHDDQGP